VASLGSYIRSAAQATFSAYRSLPIRWRLAGGSAALTFVILAMFAGIVGIVTTRQLHGLLGNQVSSAADKLKDQLHPRPPRYDPSRSRLVCNQGVRLSDYASAEHAQIRIFDDGGGSPLCTQQEVVAGAKLPRAVPSFQAPRRGGGSQELGYRVEVREIDLGSGGKGWLLYALPLSNVNQTLAAVQVFLVLGVLGGTVLALLAGLAIAQRAMRPIAQLSDAAREIERTRDPSRRLPHPEAEDEVAELARTLEGMLGALDAARTETETMLSRQREFVADASHELRTPLTSVLANLELLTEELDGEQADSAHAALRSTRRMRRLVGDLLLLARADAKRVQPSRPTDLAEVLVEAASELGPMADDHEVSIDASSVVVPGVRDELHRMVLNLLENAVRHTPPGTHIDASTSLHDGNAILVVQDDGPGIAPELQRRVFERFVRGGRDGSRGSGLGLAIVRAVARSHGGTVTLQRPRAAFDARTSDGGTRFVIAIPTAPDAANNGADPTAHTDQDQTSTTTGSTIGRRRSRS